MKKNLISIRTGLVALTAFGLLGVGALACGDDDDAVVTPSPDAGKDANTAKDANNTTDTGSSSSSGGPSDAGDAGDASDAGTTNKRLYMWSGRRSADGGAPPEANDVVVALDVDPASPTYKQVLQVVDIGTKHNEPHHGGICGGKLIVGGLASGKLYTMPIASDGTLGAVTTVAVVKGDGGSVGFVDDVVCMGDSVFVTWLSDAAGQSPGAVVEYKSSDMSVIGQYPTKDAPAETGTVNGLDLATVTGTNTFATLNPHGIAIDVASDTMLTTDSLVPASGGGGPPTFRSTVRVWKYSTREIIQTVPVCMGTVAVQFVAGTNGTQAAVACDAQASIWTMTKGGGGKWSSKLSYEPTPAVATPFGAFLGVMAADPNSKTVFVAQSEPGLLLKANLTDIDAGVVTKATLGPGAHYVHMTKNGKTLYASDYVSTAAEAAGLPASDGKVWSIDPATNTPTLLIDLHTSTDPKLTSLIPLNPHAVVPNE